MKTSLRLLAAALTCATAANAQTNMQTVIGITETDSMFRFQANMPSTMTAKKAITGMIAGQEIAGIDYRPATGQLYMLGYNPSNNSAQLYTLDTATGAATVVGANFTLQLGTGSIGFDFNPTVDRIRVVGANRNNYRLNPNTGGTPTMDGTLTYQIGDPSFPTPPSVGAVAYSNSFQLLSGTQIYYYDENLNNLATSSSPNAGTLNTVGNSGITVNGTNPHTDLDISFNPTTRQNTAYLVANTSGNTNSNLYTVDLSDGSTTPVGSFGMAVKDIAVTPMRFGAASATSRMVYALARNTAGAGNGMNGNSRQALISFPANNPRQIVSLRNITGVDSMYNIVGMDFRPATMELYALGYAGGDTSNRYRLYRIDTATGMAMAMNSGTMDTLNLGNTMEVGFDFNPTVDRIRVVSRANGANYRLNPITGAVAAMDSMLDWRNGDVNDNLPVQVSTVAYTNSYANATTTTMYGINDSGSVFVRVDTPNNGRLRTVANSIYGASSMGMSGELDFFYDSTSTNNTGYLAASMSGANMQSMLYIINTAGTVTPIDTIGYGFPVMDIAVMPMFRNGPSSVSVVQTEAPFRVFPNPADAVLRLELSAVAQSNKTWFVTDLSGRTLLQGTINAGEQRADVNVQNMATGLYLLHVDGQNPLRFNKL